MIFLCVLIFSHEFEHNENHIEITHSDYISNKQTNNKCVIVKENQVNLGFSSEVKRPYIIHKRKKINMDPNILVVKVECVSFKYEKQMTN